MISCFRIISMNKIVNKVLLAGDTFMLEMHLKQAGFTYSALLKDVLQIGLKKFLWLKKLKIQFHGHVISYLNGEKIIGTFYEKELQKANQKKFTIEKVIKIKGNKLYVKWKGYGNSFNSWINKKFVEWNSVKCNSIV